MLRENPSLQRREKIEKLLQGNEKIEYSEKSPDTQEGWSVTIERRGADYNLVCKEHFLSYGEWASVTYTYEIDDLGNVVKAEFSSSYQDAYEKKVIPSGKAESDLDRLLERTSQNKPLDESRA